MHLDTDIPKLATADHHLITRKAWCDADRSTRSFDRAIAVGILVRVDRNVAVLAGVEITPHRRIAAAVLATRAAVLVSHRSAAFVWGAPVDGVNPVDLLSPDGRGWRKAPGVRVHRPTDRQQVHAVIEKGFRVTSPLRTLVDLGAVAPHAVVPTLEHMLIRGLVTAAAVQRAIERHGRRGRPGVPALRAALGELPLGRKAPDSVLEPLAARMFERAGVTGWIFHAEVCGFEVDFAFPASKVVVELDGWAWHRTREAFERDRQRDAVLVSAGWVVLRFTWRQVHREEAWVARTIASTLAGRSQ